MAEGLTGECVMPLGERLPGERGVAYRGEWGLMREAGPWGAWERGRGLAGTGRASSARATGKVGCGEAQPS